METITIGGKVLVLRPVEAQVFRVVSAPPVRMLTCSCCGERKAEYDFTRCNSARYRGRGYRDYWCHDCRADYQRRYRLRLKVG
jgi:uncharacterized protein YlaI